ncbi:hypothetical protein [Acinetobacter bereziniae]|jgi:hypothetical protein|uniref:hypothetical protein n=1 Tax=Acinetobacter bereziniae TaxID=106648 RepID=UPI000C2C4ED7|nr:hypothetical protein [Acinetobacter bereziniae]ATZ65095.1 hypothetical protein BSR55_18045 [Acinetobacter bereziniae]MCV2445340.1 hypothetical protein [Acinetobacter bereziniae]
MKNILIIGLFLLSNTAYALTDNVIKLITEPSFNKSLCDSISKLKVQEISKEEVDRFKIDNGDYVTIRLNGNKKASCYSFKYYPETSSFIDLSLKNDTLSILEMVGSTINGNWLKKTYQINVKDKLLIKKQAKAISFSIDEKGKIQKDVSDW